MKTFHESDRYIYDLHGDSVVIDAGCHKGQWAETISEKYGCRILAFEPISEFYFQASERLDRFPKCEVFPMGVGGRTRDEEFHIKGDMSGVNAEGDPEIVAIRDILEVFSEFGVLNADVVKLNIESMEFEVLERMITSSLMPRVTNIQVQWHSCLPHALVRRNAITHQLAQTHEPTWGIGDFDNGWENWRRK